VLQRIDVVIVGGGQAGLAMSNCLTRRGIEHVVLERGQIGQRWHERRAALRLLTPSWMTRLPGHRYSGPDPDGFLRRDGVIELLESYSQESDCPVLTGVTVERVMLASGGYRVSTDRGVWIARSLIVATGACDQPSVPDFGARLHRSIEQVTADRFTAAGELPDGGVLVVGAAASGLQLADEIARSGKAVTLAAGSHVRVPRRYRGHDIFYWLDACGALVEERRPGSRTAERQPSFQLVGSDTPRAIDLETVAEIGVRVVGRARAAEGERVTLERTLAHEMARSQERLERILDRIDDFIAREGLQAPDKTRPAPIAPPDVRCELDLARDGIRTVVWATGYRRRYGWLDVDIFRDDGEIDQVGGVTPSPGLFTLGLPFMRRRNSTFIDGVGADAEDIGDAVAEHLGLSFAEAA
jgi:putative flavoprotein involved in K+ transport